MGELYGLRRANSSLDLVGNNLNINWVEGDLQDYDSLIAAVKGMDLVIHSAGLVAFASKDSDALYQVNTQGTANLVNALLSSGIERMVHVSSVAAIGRTTEETTYDEEFKWTDSPLNTEYAISKYRAELEVWRGEQEGLKVLIVNPSMILGKISTHRTSTAILDYVLQENTFYPKGKLNYIDVRDAAQITRMLVEKEAWGERFILNKESISFKEFLNRAAKVYEKKPPRMALSPVWSGTLGKVFGFLRLVGLSDNPLTAQTARIAQQKITYQPTKATELLGFSYRPLEETLIWCNEP